MFLRFGCSHLWDLKHVFLDEPPVQTCYLASMFSSCLLPILAQGLMEFLQFKFLPFLNKFYSDLRLGWLKDERRTQITSPISLFSLFTHCIYHVCSFIQADVRLYQLDLDVYPGLTLFHYGMARVILYGNRFPLSVASYDHAGMVTVCNIFRLRLSESNMFATFYFSFESRCLFHSLIEPLIILNIPSV